MKFFSVAKDLAVAASLFAFAACTDYLENFQDKYNDGNDFAEVVSGDDTDSTSNNGDVNSAGGNGSETSSATDNAAGSSSSNANNGSSTSNGNTSSSSEQKTGLNDEGCTGTVIYDANKDVNKNVFGNPIEADDSVGFIKDVGATAKIYYSTKLHSLKTDIASSDNSSSTRNITSWEGLCIEYATDGPANLYLGIENNYRLQVLPITNGEKKSFKLSWEDPKNSNNIIKGNFSTDKIKFLSFENEKSDPTNITVSKITTLAKVSLEENTSTEQHCTGTAIYENGKYKLGQVFDADNATEIVNLKDLTINSSNNQVFFYLDSVKSALSNKYSIIHWDGLCIEYSATADLAVTVRDAEKQQDQNNHPQVLKIYDTTQGLLQSRQFYWNKWSESNGYYRNNIINSSSVISFSLDNPNSTGSVKINKITTIANVPEDSLLKPATCGGKEIYNAKKSLNYSSQGYQLQFSSTNHSENSTKDGLDLIFSNDTTENYITIPVADVSSEKTIDAREWKGLCIEYTSEDSLSLQISKLITSVWEVENWELAAIPERETSHPLMVPFEKFLDFNNEGFNTFLEEINEIALVWKNDHKTSPKATIYKITTINPNVTIHNRF